MEPALTFFTAVPKLHNCAQAVAAGAGRTDLVPELASKGGGKAPDGICGALYAAMLLAAEPEAVKADFAAALGAVTCRELKMERGVPCTRCVETAAVLLRGGKPDSAR